MHPTPRIRSVAALLPNDSLASDSFVGRREELAFLHESFAIARDTQARFVPLEGEAGIGKSRLLAEFCSAIASEAIIARGDCSEHVRNPYGPLSPIFERIGAHGLREPLERGRRPNSAEKAAFFESSVRAFDRAAARKPVVAIVEDVQWADSATLELLKYLMQHLGNARVLVIAAMRVEEALPQPALAAFRHFASRQRLPALRLRGLHRNEIRHLVAAHLNASGTPVPPETLARIETLSEGNPLFAEELSRIASETGGLNLATHAPLSLQATLGERLSPLGERERAVLVRAAIVGRRFNGAFLAKILDEPVESVLGVVQRAVAAGILTVAPTNPLEFVFRHAMFRQAFADQMIVGLAAPLHARVAREIEGSHDAEQRVTELAYHWSEARVSDRARYYNERAAEAAWNVYAYRDAIGFYGTALRWEYPPGTQRAALFERLGTLLYIEGVGEEPSQWFERCRGEYAVLDDPEGAARALLHLADQYWVDARTIDSYAAAKQAATAIAPLGKPAMTAEALLSLARYAITLGNIAAAERHLAAAEALSPHFDATLQACFFEVRAETRAALGRARDALRDCAAASDIAHATAAGELIAQVDNNYALVAFDLGEPDLAIARHAIALAEARRTSMSWRVAYSALNYANTLMFKGELEQARGLAWEAIESGVTTATFKTKAAAVGIPLALLLNDRRLLEACADDAALAFAARSGEPQRIAAVTAAFAGLLLAQGSVAEARDLLERAFEAIARPHRCVSLLLRVAASNDPKARRWTERTFASASLRPCIRRALRLLSHAWTPGVSTKEPRMARLAATACARVGWRLHEAHALETAGRARDAHARYVQMGNVRDAARVADTLEATGLAGSGLSPRQVQIAHLVADGETNRTIAQRLHISEHTVEHHLSTIFTRLGLRSRSALAAYVGRSGPS